MLCCREISSHVLSSAGYAWAMRYARIRPTHICYIFYVRTFCFGCLSENIPSWGDHMVTSELSVAISEVVSIAVLAITQIINCHLPGYLYRCVSPPPSLSLCYYHWRYLRLHRPAHICFPMSQISSMLLSRVQIPKHYIDASTNCYKLYPRGTKSHTAAKILQNIRGSHYRAFQLREAHRIRRFCCSVRQVHLGNLGSRRPQQECLSAARSETTG